VAAMELVGLDRRPPGCDIGRSRPRGAHSARLRDATCSWVMRESLSSVARTVERRATDVTRTCSRRERRGTARRRARTAPPPRPSARLSAAPRAARPGSEGRSRRRARTCRTRVAAPRARPLAGLRGDRHPPGAELFLVELRRLVGRVLIGVRQLGIYSRLSEVGELPLNPGPLGRQQPPCARLVHRNLLPHSGPT
jgi:hypothetical protein